MVDKPILILKAGTTFPNTKARYGDFDDWTIRHLQVPREWVQVVEAYHDESLPEWDSFAGAVITGAHTMVSDCKPWSEALVPWIRETVNHHDMHHAFRLGPCAWGVQFHPEFDADIMRSYIEEQRDALAKHGIDPECLQAKVSETPAANALLKQFADWVLE